MTKKIIKNINYSHTEEFILKQLKDGFRLSSWELAEHIFSGRDKPFNYKIQTTNTMRTLSHKVRFNKEGFTIESTPLAGPKPKEYWIKWK